MSNFAGLISVSILSISASLFTTRENGQKSTARIRDHGSRSPAAFCRAGSVMRLRFAAFSRGQLFHGASHGRNGRPDRIQESTLQFSSAPATPSAAERQVRCHIRARERTLSFKCTRQTVVLIANRIFFVFFQTEVFMPSRMHSWFWNKVIWSKESY